MALGPSYFHVVHSGRCCCFKTGDTIFQDQAVSGVNAHPMGGFKEHVWERFPSRDLFGGDYDRKIRSLPMSG
jgi:hypothetical protein